MTTTYVVLLLLFPFHWNSSITLFKPLCLLNFTLYLPAFSISLLLRFSSSNFPLHMRLSRTFYSSLLSIGSFLGRAFKAILGFRPQNRILPTHLCVSDGEEEPQADSDLSYVSAKASGILQLNLERQSSTTTTAMTSSTSVDPSFGTRCSPICTVPLRLY